MTGVSVEALHTYLLDALWKPCRNLPGFEGNHPGFIRGGRETTAIEHVGMITLWRPDYGAIANAEADRRQIAHDTAFQKARLADLQQKVIAAAALEQQQEREENEVATREAKEAVNMLKQCAPPGTAEALHRGWEDIARDNPSFGPVEHALYYKTLLPDLLKKLNKDQQEAHEVLKDFKKLTDEEIARVIMTDDPEWRYLKDILAAEVRRRQYGPHEKAALLKHIYPIAKRSVEAMGDEEDLPVSCAAYVPNTTAVVSCSGSCGCTGAVWGEGPYMADSAVCRAARHSGAIPYTGGVFRVKTMPGQNKYVGCACNGVTSFGYGRWGSSFSIQVSASEPVHHAPPEYPAGPAERLARETGQSVEYCEAVLRESTKK